MLMTMTAVSAGAATVFYLSVLIGQGDNWLPALPFILALGAGAALAIAASGAEPQKSRRYLTITAGTYFVIGMLGLMTIGILFLAVAAMAGLAALRSVPPEA